MLGYIYNDPQLAYNEDGFYCFLDDKPHEYWCVLHVGKSVVMAPVFFDVMDNLPNSVIDGCPIQIENMTLGIGRCIITLKEKITTEPVIFLNPEKAKKAYQVMLKSIHGNK